MILQVPKVQEDGIIFAQPPSALLEPGRLENHEARPAGQGGKLGDPVEHPIKQLPGHQESPGQAR